MRFDNLREWLRWQEGLHPSTIDLGLDRVAEVWRNLGPRRLPFPVVTIAGTNGKGSCAAILESIYAEAGYRTACYTSPHLLRYNERVRIAGREVGDADLCDSFDRIDKARDATALTYFEFGTLAAIDLIRRAAVDIAILEVGLGGRLDAVNLFDADVALIAGIGRDHTAWLGDSLEDIAREKAGIFRSGRPAVVGHRKPARSLLEHAHALGCRLHVLGEAFDWEPDTNGWKLLTRESPPLHLPAPALRGDVQFDNAAAVLMAVACLAKRLPVPVGGLRRGLQRIRLPGRFQLIPGDVNWVLDVAHNAQAAESLRDNLRSLNRQGRTHAVFGMLRDKEPTAVAGALAGLVDFWHLGRTADPRSLSSKELHDAVSRSQAEAGVREYSSIESALAGAEAASVPTDCILVFGSFSTVEAALRRIGEGGAR
jgi:dihydrofolate synthase/folylpolyglutamate synthase